MQVPPRRLGVVLCGPGANLVPCASIRDGEALSVGQATRARRRWCARRQPAPWSGICPASTWSLHDPRPSPPPRVWAVSKSGCITSARLPRGHRGSGLSRKQPHEMSRATTCPPISGLETAQRRHVPRIGHSVWQFSTKFEFSTECDVFAGRSRCLLLRCSRRGAAGRTHGTMPWRP